MKRSRHRSAAPTGRAPRRRARLYRVLAICADCVIASPASFRRAGTQLLRWAGQARRQREFRGLDDRNLRDLGLSRVDQWIQTGPTRPPRA